MIAGGATDTSRPCGSAISSKISAFDISQHENFARLFRIFGRGFATDALSISGVISTERRGKGCLPMGN